MINGELYRWFPKIRESDLETNTSNIFIDTMMISNLYLKSICGDYDGDQVGVKGVYSIESNEELLNHINNSKSNFIDLGGKNIKISTNEAVQSLYCLTKVLSTDLNKLTNPEF